MRPSSLSEDKKQFTDTLQTWAQTKKSGSEAEFLKFYANDFSADDKDLTKFGAGLRSELSKLGGEPVQLSDVSLIRWSDEAEIMVATFGEVVMDARSGCTVRQYWQRRANA